MFDRLKTLFLLMLPVSSSLLVSCDSSDKNQVDDVAEAFAKEYFNWRYVESMPYVTSESAEYMKFLATNVTEDDVALLRSMESGAEVKVESTEMADDDSTAYAEVEVDNFCHADTIGRPAKLHESATATLMLVRRDGKWKVVISDEWPKMAFPQQSGMQGRD